MLTVLREAPGAQLGRVPVSPYRSPPFGSSTSTGSPDMAITIPETCQFESSVFPTRECEVKTQFLCHLPVVLGKQDVVTGPKVTAGEPYTDRRKVAVAQQKLLETGKIDLSVGIYVGMHVPPVTASHLSRISFVGE